jgi:PAS domain S-box-containing protein
MNLNSCKKFKRKLLKGGIRGNTLFLVVLFMILVGGLTAFLYSKKTVEKEEKNNLLNISGVAQAAINYRRLETLKGNEEDLENPDYQRLVEQMNLIDQSLKSFGTKWIYMMKNQDSKWIFSVDPADVNSEGYTPPGTSYDDAPEELDTVLVTKQPVIAGPYTDQWGSFVSSFYPVKDLETGEIAGVLGVDVDVAVWKDKIFQKQIQPITVTFFLSLLWTLFFIYQKKKAKNEEELQSREDRFRSIAETIKDVIFRMDLSYRISYVSPNIEKILGFSVEESIGKSFFDFIFSKELKNSGTGLEELLRRESYADSFILPVGCKNGEKIQAEISVASIKKDGAIVEFQGVLSDVTERRKNEEELSERARKLKESQGALLNVLEDVEREKKHSEELARDLEKFKLAVDNTSNHIVITDADGITLYANHAVERITGFKVKDILGKKAGNKELWGGLMEKSVYENMWKIIKTEKKTFVGEVNNRRKNGDDYVALANISPVLDKKGNVTFFVGIERDITEEKEIDRAKTEFVSLASHQLRTPLSAINWYTEMLLAGDAGKLNAEQRQFLEQVYTGNQRMVNLVNALLNVSRIELGTLAVDPKLIDFYQIADSVLADLKKQITEKKIKVETKYDKFVPKINADPNIIRIIFQNLLTNAIKYMPEKGKVSVSLRKEKEHVLIQISDSGYGIPDHQQDRIFEKMFRADNVREKETEGTGLGLYMTKSVVESAKGKIWFESEENKGTTFYITLPLSGMEKKEGSKTLNEEKI